MPTIYVAKPFNLLLSPTAPRQHFDVGEHDVTDEVANHWYTQEHLANSEAAEEAEAQDEAAEAAAEVVDPSAKLDDAADREDDPPADDADDADLVDAMNDDELRAFITERDGKAPHHKLGHDKLLALAKGDANADSDDEEQAAEA